jgi:hypothetical protein
MAYMVAAPPLFGRVGSGRVAGLRGTNLLRKFPDRPADGSEAVAASGGEVADEIRSFEGLKRAGGHFADAGVSEKIT